MMRWILNLGVATIFTSSTFMVVACSQDEENLDQKSVFEEDTTSGTIAMGKALENLQTNYKGELNVLVSNTILPSEANLSKTEVADALNNLDDITGLAENNITDLNPDDTAGELTIEVTWGGETYTIVLGGFQIQVAHDEIMLTEQVLSVIEGNPVEEDGLYLVEGGIKNSVLYDANDMSSTPSSTGIEKLEDGYYSWYVVQMESGDSIYMIYDEDDSDGFAPASFTENVYFNDTSVAVSDEIEKANTSLGNTVLGWDTLIPFNESGNLNFYVGSQSNHDPNYDSQSFDDAIKLIEDNVDKITSDENLQNQIVEAITSYYDSGASKSFQPLLFVEPVFTYQQISDNVFQITLNDENALITAARFALVSTTETTQNTYVGTFSIGENDWQYYESNPSYKFISEKN